ncbi:LLM class flavin-dependent oxidoreductase [Paenibacillus sp. CN-4]|uniref:LLM class flavin-dependent oxidoreductase n=1 Tax=Paenibacillus nanchangensis TaxID=3348343 RepID=UPI00397ABEF7
MSNDPHQAAGPVFEFGVYTLGDIVPDRATGRAATPKQRMDEIVAAARLADEAGLDVFGVGEHHRLDFAVSSVPVVLAAISQVTRRIRLTSATTVLSTADPVRVFEDFATLDLLSGGRAEIISGRGAFLESFPLFGYQRDDYRQLFEENLRLLSELNEREIVTWSGQFRSPLQEAEIAPRPLQPRLPLWVGVGGTPETAAFAGEIGAGLAIAILSGQPERFAGLADAYRKAGADAGHAPDSLKIGITSHAYLAPTAGQALDEFYPYYCGYLGAFDEISGGTRLGRDEFESYLQPGNALAVGGPDEIVEKIMYQHEQFGHRRFMAQMDIGGVPFDKVAASIELLATEVAPRVRRLLAAKDNGGQA